MTKFKDHCLKTPTAFPFEIVVGVPSACGDFVDHSKVQRVSPEEPEIAYAERIFEDAEWGARPETWLKWRP